MKQIPYNSLLARTILMKKVIIFNLILICTILMIAHKSSAQNFDGIPAFPEAEGFGAWATGGRGGIVIEVTNLNDDGPGSLRAAINDSGPRTIVFRVSGTIELESALSIRNGDLTIAGQTAPGDGICISNFQTSVAADNVIIRHIRFRLGDKYGCQCDPLGGRNVKHVIIDHCSLSWSVDETISFYHNDSTTIQWCLISESLDSSVHKKGPHGYGGIWGGSGASFHHNLFAHHRSRNPRFASAKFPRDPEMDLVDFRNNVIYNWGELSIYGGEKRKHNVVANYFKPGPATMPGPIQYMIILPFYPLGSFFIDKNYIYGHQMATDDNWAYGILLIPEHDKKKMKQNTPYEVAPITETSAEQAFLDVIENVGATAPRRDSTDIRVINDVINGTGSSGTRYGGGGKGIIDSPDDVGGWPVLRTYNVLIDSDHDGMPDEWEISQGLNPEDSEDRNHIAEGEVYTNLERYLNSLASNKPYLLRPIKLEAERSVNNQQVELSWKDISNDETGFSIERAGVDGIFKEIGRVQANITEFTDRNVDLNTTYSYKVFAFNRELQSLPSNIAVINNQSGKEK